MKLYGNIGSDSEGYPVIASISLTPYKSECVVCEFEGSICTDFQNYETWKPYNMEITLDGAPDFNEDGVDIFFKVKEGKICGEGTVRDYNGKSKTISKKELLEYIKQHREYINDDYPGLFNYLK